MAKMSTDELLDVFKEMTLLELSEFVKQFETTFEVTAAAPVAAAARTTSPLPRQGRPATRRSPLSRRPDRRALPGFAPSSCVSS